jgi:hypothetical protein
LPFQFLTTIHWELSARDHRDQRLGPPLTRKYHQAVVNNQRFDAQS